MSLSIMSLRLLYPKILENKCVEFNLPLRCHIYLSYTMGFDKIIPQRIQPHHVVIIVIIAMLALCYSIMSHATLMLYDHASMITLQTSLISHALWLPCT